MKQNKPHQVQINTNGKTRSLTTTHNVQWINYDKKTKQMSIGYDVNKNKKSLKVINYSGKTSEKFMKALRNGNSVGKLINKMLGNTAKGPMKGISANFYVTSGKPKNKRFATMTSNIQQMFMNMGQKMNNGWNPQANQSEWFGVKKWKKDAPINQTKNAHNELQKLISGGK